MERNKHENLIRARMDLSRTIINLLPERIAWFCPSKVKEKWGITQLIKMELCFRHIIDKVKPIFI